MPGCPRPAEQLCCAQFTAPPTPAAAAAALTLSTWTSGTQWGSKGPGLPPGKRLTNYRQLRTASGPKGSTHRVGGRGCQSLAFQAPKMYCLLSSWFYNFYGTDTGINLHLLDEANKWGQDERDQTQFYKLWKWSGPSSIPSSFPSLGPEKQKEVLTARGASTSQVPPYRATGPELDKEPISLGGLPRSCLTESS